MSSEFSSATSGASLDPQERERLLTDHLPQVRYIAQRIHDRLPVQIPLEDLVHAGVVGLIDAVDRYDPNKHVQLGTYAKFRIRGAILDSLRDTDWSPRSLRRRARAVEEASRHLSTELGRAPSEAELARHLSMDVSEFQHLLSELNGLNLGSLDAAREDDSLDETYAFKPNGPHEDPFFLCLQGEFKSLLAEAMNSLTEKERQVVALYYYEELTMKEVGAALGVGESRVSQIHSLAIVRLRARLQELLEARERAASVAPAE